MNNEQYHYEREINRQGINDVPCHKEITIEYLTDAYNDLAGLLKDNKDTEVKKVITIKTLTLAMAITIVKEEY